MGRSGLRLAFAVFATSLLACAQEKVDANGPPPTPIPIRRLTNAEYTATVVDLFPGYELPEMVLRPRRQGARLPQPVQLADRQPGAHGAVRDGGVRHRADGDRRSDGADRLRRRRAGRGDLRAGRTWPDFGKRAYRRPLTGAELDGLMALLARRRGHRRLPTRLAMVVQAMLLSPKFLFRPEIGDRAQAGRAGRSADVVGDGDAGCRTS